ncbi:MAG TPA: DivIVA domain-containing protein [Acidimicrobiales bacterium]|nr:DivIVA domain-containing protein [Acidimicrobiales bacterium]
MAVNTPDGAAGMSPEEVARKSFSMVRKGFDPIEVQGFLLSVSNELRQARADLLDLDRELRAAQEDARAARELDPAKVTALLGEETVKVLDAARLAAEDMKAKADQAATEHLRQATEESGRLRREASEILQRRTAEAEAEVDKIRAHGEALRAQAEAEAAAEVERGRQQGREMVAEAQKVRERMLNDLARRRKHFRQQIERLQAGRDRLMSAYDVVRETLDAATEELQVAMPEARLAAEAAALRASEEEEASVEQLEAEAAALPEPERVATASGDAEAGEAAEAEPEPEPEPEPVDTGPRAPSDTSVEGRRSSSVNVIRGDTGPHPVVEAAPEAAPERVETAAEEPAEPAQATPASAPAPAEVSSLFARIREEVVETSAEGDRAAAEEGRGEAPEVVVTGVVEEIELVEEVVVDDDELAELARAAEAAAEGTGEAGTPAAPADPDHELLARRDEALAETERSLGRRIKRELSDEQNELLDTVRRQKGTPDAAKALPEHDEHRSRYRAAVLPSLVAAAQVGADLVADSPDAAVGARIGTKTNELATELAAEIVDQLRDRLERCFSDTVGDRDELAERVRACYREWKGQRVDELVSRFTLASANQGLLDRLAEGTLVHWVVADGSTPSPDCDDNALAGDLPKGEVFPTGHTAPPISSSCRCLVAPKSG